MKVELVQMTEPKFADIAAGCCTHEDIPDAHPEFNRLQSACFSGHLGIMEHISVTFEISGISRACSHQLVRHRMASYAQQSQRYVKKNEQGYVTPDSIRHGSDGEHSYKERFDATINAIMYQYNWLVAHGVPEEDARYLLPNACCTNIVVTMNLREASHFCALRRCSRAQWELREVADRMAEQIIDKLESYGVIGLNGLFGPACAQNGYCKEQRSDCRRRDYYNPLESSFYNARIRNEIRKTLEKSEQTKG